MGREAQRRVDAASAVLEPVPRLLAAWQLEGVAAAGSLWSKPLGRRQREPSHGLSGIRVGPAEETRTER